MSEENTITTEEITAYDNEQLVQFWHDYGSAGFEGMFEEAFTVPQLRDFAKAREINLGGRDAKSDIIGRIAEWVEGLVRDAADDDTETDNSSEGDDGDGDTSDGGVEEEPAMVGVDPAVESGEDVQPMELATALNTIQDEYKQAVASLSRELDEVKAELIELRKLLKAKPKSDTLHGSIDDLTM